jgi:hypothetical protein
MPIPPGKEWGGWIEFITRVLIALRIFELIIAKGGSNVFR